MVGAHKVGPVQVGQNGYPGFTPVLGGILQGIITYPGGHDHTSRIGRGELRGLECYWRTSVRGRGSRMLTE